MFDFDTFMCRLLATLVASAIIAGLFMTIAADISPTFVTNWGGWAFLAIWGLVGVIVHPALD